MGCDGVVMERFGVRVIWFFARLGTTMGKWDGDTAKKEN